MANPFKTNEFLDVEVDQPARFPIFIAHNRFGRGQVANPRQASPMQNPADRGGRHPGLQRNMKTAQAPAA